MTPSLARASKPAAVLLLVVVGVIVACTAIAQLPAWEAMTKGGAIGSPSAQAQASWAWRNAGEAIRAEGPARP